MNRYRMADLSLGQSASFETVVTAEDLNEFRRLSGDENPLHCDAEYARRHGHADRVVYGMLAASQFSALAGVHLPGEACLLHGMDIDFHAPIYPGERITVRGEISYIQEALGRLEIKASIVGPDGRLRLKAKIRAGVRDDAPKEGR